MRISTKGFEKFTTPEYLLLTSCISVNSIHGVHGHDVHDVEMVRLGMWFTTNAWSRGCARVLWVFSPQNVHNEFIPLI